jgi:hypothetical protein
MISNYLPLDEGDCLRKTLAFALFFILKNDTIILTNMEHKKINITLLILTALSSFASWYSVERAINLQNSSIWLVPTICFSFYFIFLCLCFVMIKKTYVLEILILVTFLPSFIFSWDISRIVAFLFASLGMAVAIHKIKKDLLLNIKVDLGKSIGTAKTIMIVSIALMISSQYYDDIKDKEIQKMFPKFDFSRISNAVTPRVLSFMNPQFKNVDSNSSTVDEFILQIQKNQIEDSSLENNENRQIDEMIEKQGGASLTQEQKDAIKKDALEKLAQSKEEIQKSSQAMVLEEGRKKLSEMSGKNLSGSEKISSVFSDIVNNKINTYLAPSMDQGSMPILPIIIAVILFFTIISLGNLLSVLLVQLVKLIFKIFVHYDWVMIRKIQTEVESIE